MNDLDTILENATANGSVPYVVAMHGNAAGVDWSGTSGDRKTGIAASLDTVFRIFSMTKSVGSTAAMILVERGQLDLDTPVVEIIPEFAKNQVLEGFDGDNPILRAPKGKATVRQLMTHTSGLVYEGWNANCSKYLKVTGTPNTITGEKASLYTQLASDPGSRWEYGIGIDWLGLVIETIDGRRIDQFCKHEIFDKLDMNDTGFEANEAMNARLGEVYARGDDGEFSQFQIGPASNPEFYGLGGAMYSTAPDYMNFIRMFLNKGELGGQRILSEATLENMLENHIGKLRVGPMPSGRPGISREINFFPDIPKTHSLGFMRNEEEIPGRRSAGSQSWAGLCNTHYWFDPARDVAGLIMTQSLPFVEKPFMDLYDSFERAVYSG